MSDKPTTEQLLSPEQATQGYPLLRQTVTRVENPQALASKGIDSIVETLEAKLAAMDKEIERLNASIAELAVQTTTDDDCESVKTIVREFGIGVSGPRRRRMLSLRLIGWINTTHVRVASLESQLAAALQRAETAEKYLGWIRHYWRAWADLPAKEDHPKESLALDLCLSNIFDRDVPLEIRIRKNPEAQPAPEKVVNEEGELANGK